MKWYSIILLFLAGCGGPVQQAPVAPVYPSTDKPTVVIEVRGTSMIPVLNHGDVLHIADIWDELQVGNIVSFRYDNMNVIKQVVSISEDGTVAVAQGTSRFDKTSYFVTKYNYNGTVVQ